MPKPLATPIRSTLVGIFAGPVVFWAAVMVGYVYGGW